MRRRATWLVAPLVAALLTGCGLLDDDPAEPAPGGTSGPGATAAADGSGGSDGPGGKGSARVETVDPAVTLAKQTVALPTRPRDKVEVGIQSLTVRGKVMELRVVVTPRFTTQPADTYLTVYKIFDENDPSPFLIDREHFKRYTVVDGGPAGVVRWQSDPVDVGGVNGSPVVLSYVFAAPQDAAPSFDVHVTDWMPPFTDVTVTT